MEDTPENHQFELQVSSQTSRICFHELQMHTLNLRSNATQAEFVVR